MTEGLLYLKIHQEIKEVKKAYGLTELDLIPVSIVEQVLDEATQDFPLNPKFKSFKPEDLITNAVVLSGERLDWYKKWFGASK